jgi:ubiquinone/menaquinone biosynthesis C-methylase UbiE
MNNLSNSEKVKIFFQGYSEKFNAIYGSENDGIITFIVNRLFRYSMHTRFKKTAFILSRLKAKTLLDVGCGPGVHDAILAREYGINVVGIDVAESMIKLALNNVEQAGVSSMCNFHTCKFEDFPLCDLYDAVLSLGVLEYIENPTEFIRSMAKVSTKVVIFSLPAKWHILVPQRIFRYRLRGCPLWFYSRSKIKKIIPSLIFSKYEIINLGRDYLVVCYK